MLRLLVILISVIGLGLGFAQTPEAPLEPTTEVEQAPSTEPVSTSTGQPTEDEALPELNVVLVNPSTPGDGFWDNLTSFAQAAAEDLNIALEVLYADRDRARMLELVREVAARNSKPDAILFQNLKQNGLEALTITNAAEIPTFIINAGLDYEAEEVGYPREHFSYWLGDLIPDDRRAGYTLATLLVDTAKELGLTNAEGEVNLLAFAGASADTSSRERVAGLEDALAELESVNLLQIVPANWSESRASEKFYWLSQRYPEIHAVWAANDSMAVGTAQQAETLGILRTDDPETQSILTTLIAGIDWNDDALNKVENLELLLSLGGHFMDGGWAMVLLRDYFEGIDFAEDTTMLRSQHAPLSNLNVGNYRRNFSDGDWNKIDFRNFSKSYNPDLTQYSFTVDTILDQLTNR